MIKRSSLLWKFILAFLVVTVTTAGLVAVFIRVTSVDRLTSLIIDQQRGTLQTTLEEYYKENGSWKGIASAWPQMRFRPFPVQGVIPGISTGVQVTPALVQATPAAGAQVVPYQSPDRVSRDRRGLFGLADDKGVVLVENDAVYPVGTIVPASILKQGTDVMVDGKQVGTILPARFIPGFNPEENLFLQRTTEALIYAVIGAMLVALLIGILIARTLVRPLDDLTRAAQNIANGHLDQQVDIRSHDEIGQLGEAFNRMSQEVARVNLMRKQMTADIAHDLRTPLTVIAGYIESMRDGVLQPTTARLDLIYSEIEGLQHLVGDLKMLSQMDAGELPLHPQRLEVGGMLEHAAATFSHRAEQQGVELEVDSPEPQPEVNVDEGRMMQVFGNLLSNALRYTPPGGKITLAGSRSDGKVILSVRDTGEGIAEEDLGAIFDRFQRADKSRHAESGETGLGLAIVKALVEAHHGSVRAESTLGAGTTIFIELPIA